jgi:hypothetical protein
MNVRGFAVWAKRSANQKRAAISYWLVVGTEKSISLRCTIKIAAAFKTLLCRQVSHAKHSSFSVWKIPHLVPGINLRQLFVVLW